MLETNSIQQPIIFANSDKNYQTRNYYKSSNECDTFEKTTATEQKSSNEFNLNEKFLQMKNYLIQDNKINNTIKNNINYFDYDDCHPDLQTSAAIEEIPIYPATPGRRDARGWDISALPLSEDELLNLCIDKTTVMSPEQKAIVDVYMERTKDPGLGIRDLHNKGITGKGVKMAIIDQPLGKHNEYSSNIVHLEDINANKINLDWNKASMHGAAVASIAVGKTVGVAPDADLVYFSAVNLSTDPKAKEQYIANLQKAIQEHQDDPHLVARLNSRIDQNYCFDNTPYVEAINKILDMNKGLPDNEKIQVIFISWGFDEYAPGYQELQQAIQRAKDEGVFVVSTALESHYGMSTCGANRNPKGDLNSPETYEAGAFWKANIEKGRDNTHRKADTLLLAPMDHRTVADYTDETSYRYEGNDGGMSWSTPWLAGMYVLAKQVKPNVTPEEFWNIALKTSDVCKNNDTGTYVGRLINPQKIIETLQR